MDKYVIKGGRPLKGTVDIRGAKNAAVAILPATLLVEEPCIIENLPNISDVSVVLNAMREMGADIRRLGKHTIQIDTRGVRTHVVTHEMSRNIRAVYYFLGALLGRFGRASVCMPGGCNLGSRPIDLHTKALTALGAECDIEYGMVNAVSKGLVGSEIFFDTISVGATINSILAACRSDGLTVLENVAKEPHIVDIANFLNTMGADIRGAGTDVIKIRGVERLRGVEYSVVPDQIEAGTYMAAAGATGGDVIVRNIIPKHLESIMSKLVKAGVEIEEHDDSVRVTRTGPLLNTNIRTMPHPGFPTDMQPQMAALLSMAQGTSIITEGIWDNRFRYVEELRRMGAQIQVDGKVAVIEGVERLTPAPVRATDLRAGAAMLIAAFSTEGESQIEDVHHIDRGYEDVVERFGALGADIKRVEVRGEEERAAL